MYSADPADRRLANAFYREVPEDEEEDDEDEKKDDEEEDEYEEDEYEEDGDGYSE